MAIGVLAGATSAQAQLPRQVISHTCSSCEPVSADSADFDGDGALDVVAASVGDDKIVWYENDGRQSFTPHTIASGVDAPMSVRTADLNGDGPVDIVAAIKLENRVVWYENDGSGSFTAHTLTPEDGGGEPTGLSTTSAASDVDVVRVGDLDGDGDRDVVAGSSGEIAWYENTGSGFASRTVISSEFYGNALEVGNLDGDNDDDVVFATATGSTTEPNDAIYWLRSDGSGGFSSRKRVVVNHLRGKNLSVADVDGDGSLDLVSVAAGGFKAGEGANWHENDGSPGDGGWTTHSIDLSTNDAHFDLHAAEMTGDGYVDLVTGSKPRVKLLENDGTPKDGGWAVKAIADPARDTKSVTTADLNGDGTLDVLYTPSRNTGSVRWVANDGSGAFSEQRAVSALSDANNVEAARAADLDGDGDTDVLSRGLPMVWFENDGTQTFTTHPITFRVATSFQEADLDGDGDPDLVAAFRNESAAITRAALGWYENDGSGSFSRLQPIATDIYGTDLDVRVTDLTGDGTPDVIVGTGGSSVDRDGDGDFEEPAGVYWYQNDGSPSFSEHKISYDKTSGGVIYRSVEAGDMNGDGRPDIIATTETPPSSSITPGISWWKNQGAGSFETGPKPANVVATPDSTNRPDEKPFVSIQTVDLNGDGATDLLSRTSNNLVDWHENDGNADFTTRWIQTPAIDKDGGKYELITSVSTGDPNDDGNVDLLTGSGSRVAWYRNDGTETFRARTIDDAWKNQSAVVQSVVASDLDGDGDSDLLSASTGDDLDTAVKPNEVAWYENTDLKLPKPPTNPSVDAVRPKAVPQGVENLEVSWTASTANDVKRYLIYRRKEPFIDGATGGVLSPDQFESAIIDSVPAGQTTYTDDDPLLQLQADTTYHYRITALDDFGNASEFSAEVTATPAPPLAAHTIRPKSGAPGMPVRIRGSGFATQASAHTVRFGSATATVDSATASALHVRVPSGVSGPAEVTLQTENQTLTLPGRFTVVTGGHNTFSPVGTEVTPVHGGFSSFDWGDYDGDTDLDLVAVGEDDRGNRSTTLYRNQSGTLTSVDAGLPNLGDSGAWGDANGDGRLDIVLVGPDESGTERTVVARNQGNGSFTTVVAGSDGIQENGAGLPGITGAASWQDYDTDGDLDLSLVDPTRNRPTLYRNDEQATFRCCLDTRATPRIDKYRHPDGYFTSLVGGRRSVDWGDYNGDGLPDLLVVGNYTKVYRNTGRSVFQEVLSLEIGSGMAQWGDYDRDGDLDFVVVGRDGGKAMAEIWQNKGKGTFEPVGAGLSGANSGQADWGDFDGDGDLDLVVAGETGDIYSNPVSTEASIYRNDGGAFTAVGAGLAEPVEASVEWGDVDSDGDLDLVMAGQSPEDGDLLSRLYRNDPPQAAAAKTVGKDGTVAFGSTGAKITFSGTSGSGTVTVQRLDYGRSDAEGIGRAHVSTYRFVIEEEATLDFSSAQIRLSVADLAGISDPGSVKIYKRPEPGAGSFTGLTTNLDKNGTPNNLSDDILTATTDSFSEFILASDTEPLPVELVDFDAKAKDGSVRLSWRTSSEVNNAVFEVQRREETAPWTTIGRVDGGGTTTESKIYRFTDSDVPYEADSLTYRLRQVDTDGSARYSRIAVVERGVEEVQLLGTYPNPASHQTTVRYALPEARTVTLRLYDTLGRRVRTVTNKTQKGRHTATLDVNGLPSGLYFLRLRAGSRIRTQKVTVVQ